MTNTVIVTDINMKIMIRVMLIMPVSLNQLHDFA